MIPAPLQGQARRPAHRPLKGRMVRMRLPHPDRDAPPLFAATHGAPEREAVWDFMAYGPFVTAEAMAGWMDRCAGSSDPLFFVVADAKDGAPLGMASFMSMVPEMRRIELGHIWLEPRAQGTGALPDLVHLMLREAFEVLGYRRVEWKCDARNERSRRAALGLGFTFEGTFRQHMIVKGSNRDTAWFSMLDGEWPQAGPALEARIGATRGR